MTASHAGGAILVDIEDRICTVTLNRPGKHNAFTMPMFDALITLGEKLRTESAVRVVCFRGAGGRALAAGADIAGFTSFTSGEDGVAYESVVVRALRAVSELPQVTLAVIEGLAVGGGLALASACDLRIATTGARIGYPIAATLGNCLSAFVLKRCVAVFGDSLVREMLLTARLLPIDRAHAAGAVSDIVEGAELDEHLTMLLRRIAHLAPGTQLATKRTLGALADGADPDDRSEMLKVYGSNDFTGAVRAFLDKRAPEFSATLDL